MGKTSQKPNGFVSDGHPADSVHYREYKLILLPDRFTSRDALHAFSKLVREAAKDEDVDVARAAVDDECLLREIVFYDTPRFDLYESAFILRQHAARVFPALRSVLARTGPLEVVQRARITELLEEVGVLDFGHGLTAKATVALWRAGVVGPSLIGELAYQCKFQRDADVHVKALKRADELYSRLQAAARDWLALGVTKTRVVYAFGKTAPHHHE